MMEAVSSALADPTIRDWYLMFCMGVMMVPMIFLAIWYHLNIGKSDGGRKLMEWQGARNLESLLPWGTATNVAKSGKTAKDIQRGRYGTHARDMQNRVYWFVGFWLLANVIVFGILIWAEEVNKVAVG